MRFRMPTPATVLASIAVFVVLGGTAFAAQTLITGQDIKDQSVTGVDIKPGSIGLNRLTKGAQSLVRSVGNVGASSVAAAGAAGATGPQGQAGPTGPQGAKGDSGTQGAKGDQGDQGPGFSGEKWGVIGRNTYGSPVTELRLGPWGRASAADIAATQPPPSGEGSLGIEVAAAPTVGDPEKAAWGNQTDFAGLKISDITHLSYWVFTDEDDPTGHALPNVTLEVDPGTPGHTYTSFVYIPPVGTPGKWVHYDTLAADARWFSTRNLDAATDLTGPCERDAATRCTWDQLKTAAGPNAKVSYSLGISKGRDNSFHGAVDALRVNSNLYDFELTGVKKIAQP